MSQAEKLCKKRCCSGKKIFTNRGVAALVAGKQSERTKMMIVSYRCKKCGHYHVKRYRIIL